MTIIIMLIIVGIALIAVAVFAGSARRILINRLRIAGYNIGAWWNNHAVGQGIWNAIRPAIWIIAILIGLMFLAWIPLFVIVVAICTSMGSFWSGIFLGLLVLVCGFLFILKKIPGFRLVGTISYYLALILLIVFFWNFIFGWWSPGVQESWERLKENQKQELGDWMNETSTETEGKSGKIGRIDIDGLVGYSEDGMKTYPIKKGKFARLVNEYKGKKASKASEGLIWIMIENEHGDFVKGDIYLIPSRKINWDWQPKPPPETQKSPVNVPAASAPSEKWKLCWKKPESYNGLTQTKSRCDAVEVKFSEQGFRLEAEEVGGLFSITGDRTGENSYKGIFQNKAGGGGDIFLKFSPDFKLATGWQKDSGSQEEVYTWLTH